jgi:uncharacterized membrane-anchored protein
MKKVKWIVILINSLLLLFLFNRSVVEKEDLLLRGQLVLLELAPVDPRSLMQGDFMRLRYAISEAINTDSISPRGYYVVKLKDNGVAQRIRLQEGNVPLHDRELLIRYNAGEWTTSIGAESYFFQEGDADKYAEARYGGIRVDKSGESILVGLYDKERKLIR